MPHQTLRILETEWRQNLTPNHELQMHQTEKEKLDAIS